MADQTEMGLMDHFAEARNRLLKAMAALVIATALSLFLFGQDIVGLLAMPVGGLDRLIAIDPTESIGVYMRISLLAGLIGALPFIVYQILAFIFPGLLENEKRWVLLAVPVSTLLFISGVAFSYYVMLPAALPFLLNFMIQTTPRVSTYVDFVTNMMFWIGVSFEAPLLIFMLAKFNVVSASMLAKQWRYALVIIAILAAVITPTPDPVNMSILMVPLFAIYLLCILFAWIARR